MAQAPKDAYAELERHHRRLHAFRHATAMLAWDRNTLMPPASLAARATAEAELAAAIQQLRADPHLDDLLAAAADAPLDAWQRANLREMRRDWIDATAVPPALAEAQALAAAHCEHGWRRQRPANDWQAFLPAFREVLRLAREEARHLADAKHCLPYDALVDRFEPGMDSATLGRLFDTLQGWLPGRLDAAIERQADDAPMRCSGPFDLDAQRALARDVSTLLGFDTRRGRLDESAHPFTGGVAADVRMTTRFSPADPLVGLNGTIHETGHARYMQGLPAAWAGQPVGEARSFGIHESQSLAFEMQLARGPAFCALLSPLLTRHLGSADDFSPEALLRRQTRVARGRIRVSADELSYPLHILLRFRIERALIACEIEAEDVPAYWDEQMAALLGLDTRGDYRDGCMQDIHWTKGAFGYFPSYTLGALYAAQWFAALRRDIPDLDRQVAEGRLEGLFEWLAARVWSQASLHDTDTLLRQGSGSALDPEHFRRHVEQRYFDGAAR